MSIERRDFCEQVEFRSDGNRKITATGTAIRYNAISQDLGGFRERALPGVATKSIGEHDIRALANHDPNLLLGRLSSGTLRLHDDKDRLAYEIDLPDTTAGRDWGALIERGDISGSSFGFRTIKDSWDANDKGTVLRSLEEISIRDLGPVTFPAYEAATAEVALRCFADSHGFEYRSVVDAAQQGALATLLDPQTRDESPDDDGGEDDEPTAVVRPRIAWLY
jgi:hypothetical protein